jgi:hypothetical protein
VKKLLIALGMSVLACAPAPHLGDEIAVVEESAVIVWDAPSHTEHFIRRATFRGKGRDFGFLVPVPDVPVLEAVSDELFDKLEERTERETVYTTRGELDFTPFVLLKWTHGSAILTGAAAPVEVLSTQKVGGYEAAILSATDAGALQKWLSENGYDATPDLVEWLDAYVRKQWKIAAFKIDASKPEARTSAVKMSFTAERPFFPYREPASQRRLASEKPENRALRVWFLGAERVVGRIGDGSTSWPAVLRRSDPLPEAPRMTAFLDQSSIRPGVDDLFFLHSAVQSNYVEPPYVIETVDTTHVPLDLVAIGLAIVAFAIRRVVRRV